MALPWLMHVGVCDFATNHSRMKSATVFEVVCSLPLTVSGNASVKLGATHRTREALTQCQQGAHPHDDMMSSKCSRPRTSRPHLHRMDLVRVGVVQVGHLHDENDVIEVLTAPQQMKVKVPVHNLVAKQPQQLVRGRHSSPRLRQRKVESRRKRRLSRQPTGRAGGWPTCNDQPFQRPWLHTRQGQRWRRRCRSTRRRRTRPRHPGCCTRPHLHNTRAQSASLRQMRRGHTHVVHIAKCLAAPPPPFYLQCPTFETTSDEYAGTLKLQPNENKTTLPIT
jgi:hypothetical protein